MPDSRELAGADFEAMALARDRPRRQRQVGRRAINTSERHSDHALRRDFAETWGTFAIYRARVIMQAKKDWALPPSRLRTWERARVCWQGLEEMVGFDITL